MDAEERLRSWVPGKDRADQEHGKNQLSLCMCILHSRHNISLGVNIPPTCACLTVDENLCGGNASSPANGQISLLA